ncbi:L,D-transpeptidase [Rhodoplanes sp. Z2-YC6860]|uniref:L,D-transpeptidase n=1 Tax=Rhodoplanes sp. Z2-YC6860 TaxID=674703 RepID=UPI00078CE08D|nr:L,D-transpeptidase [Rhodoplanes sp. Z2-YC6860]AMN40032.1 ErfK/YbiS/YcfS/YnhG protein [Rhodoplanes sp. Z2-YC6860]
MYRHMFAALAMSAIGVVAAGAEPLSIEPQRPQQSINRPASPVYVYRQSDEIVGRRERPAPARYVNNEAEPNMGGGFIEFLFSGGQVPPPRPPSNMMAARGEPAMMQQQELEAQNRPIDPKFERQLVDYAGSEPAGTIVIDTPQRFLFLVQGNGKALRYGIGVGKPGFSWAGEKKITAKKEWPDWTPPAEMLQRRPDLPHFMAGGPDNPLGARAMYLGTSLYRIHGSNEPWTIGHAVSSGCIRMRNEDVTDLYERVKVGTRVIVI